MADGKPGIAVLHGMTGQGGSDESMSLFDLTGREMRDLTDGLGVVSTNVGACGSWSPECWTIESKWHFEKNPKSAYDDLLIDFSGFRETRKEGEAETVPRIRKNLTAHARYTFKDGMYKLVDGETILPKI